MAINNFSVTPKSKGFLLEYVKRSVFLNSLAPKIKLRKEEIGKANRTVFQMGYICQSNSSVVQNLIGLPSLLARLETDWSKKLDQVSLSVCQWWLEQLAVLESVKLTRDTAQTE